MKHSFVVIAVIKHVGDLLRLAAGNAPAEVVRQNCPDNFGTVRRLADHNDIFEAVARHLRLNCLALFSTQHAVLLHCVAKATRLHSRLILLQGYVGNLVFLLFTAEHPVSELLEEGSLVHYLLLFQLLLPVPFPAPLLLLLLPEFLPVDLLLSLKLLPVGLAISIESARAGVVVEAVGADRSNGVFAAIDLLPFLFFLLPARLVALRQLPLLPLHAQLSQLLHLFAAF